MTTNKRLLDAALLRKTVKAIHDGTTDVETALQLFMLWSGIDAGAYDAKPAEVNAEGDEDGPGAEDGPWAEGWEQRPAEAPPILDARPTSQWIPASERLPDFDVPVFVWSGNPSSGSGWPDVAVRRNDGAYESSLGFRINKSPFTYPF